MEILHNGAWGTICDDRWGINDAGVACRQLGYYDGLKAFQGSDVPDGTGQIWLDEVACTGNEQYLRNCSHNGWGSHDCSHGKDAGVECLTSGNVINSGGFKSGMGVIGHPNIFAAAPNPPLGYLAF